MVVRPDWQGRSLGTSTGARERLMARINDALRAADGRNVIRSAAGASHHVVA
jgi:fructoselysine-6-P-deglycase FrlB-like protein